MRPIPCRLALALALACATASVHADDTPQALPFSQDWSDTGLITTSHDWSRVPGIIGYRGDGLAGGAGADPRTILAPDSPGVVNVNANQANPDTYTTGGVAEFHLADPVVALQGSGTARAPYIRIHLDTRGASNIHVSYRLRDIDRGNDNSVQPVALHYRVGGSGDFTSVAEAFVADASDGPGLGKDTPVSVTLPAAADNQPLVELRIMTADAAGSDEWIGIDDIRVVALGGGGVEPVVNVGNASVAEGDSGTTAMAFQVGLTQPAGQGGVGFDYATVDGSALAGKDYIAASGHMVIAEGETSVTVPIDVIGDTVVESDESFGLQLSGIHGAQAGTLLGTGTILNDDFSTVSIAEIQGPGSRSPLEGQVVVTTGIVTARKNNGFFLQTPDSEVDDEPETSEGVFVFTAGTPGPEAAVGNRVRVQGTVLEYIPAADPYQLPMTELGSATVTRLSAGHALPEPVVIDAQRAAPDGGLDQLERFEGMRVRVPGARVVAPTRGFTNEPSATSTGNGQFAVVAAGVERPLREPGIQVPDPDPGGTTATAIPRWDFNPEVIAVDSDAIGAPQADLAAGCRIVLDTLTGPLDYTFRRYTIYPETALATECDGFDQPRSSQLPTADHASFATYNLQRFFDTVNDPGISEPVLTSEAFEARLAKASLGIRGWMHSPDVVGVSEVENLGALQALAQRLNSDAVAAGAPDPGYQAYLEEGNDVGGIDVGFLVKAGATAAGLPRVEVLSVHQLGARETWTYPGDGSTSLLNDRPPLLLDARVHFDDPRVLPVTVVAVHQRSLSGIADETPLGTGTNGDRVRQKRQRQAEFLATALQDLQAAEPGRKIVVLGDFNAFEFNDGHADVMGTVTGMPSPDDATAVDGDGAELVDPVLYNATWSAPDAERYSFVFENNAQSLDHILVNEAVLSSPRIESLSMSHARINADFPETARNDATSPLRLSDHDPSVLLLRLRAVEFADMQAVVTATPPAVAVGGTMTWQVRATNAGPDAARFPGLGLAADAALADLSIDAPDGWACDAPVVTEGETTAACTAETLGGGASAAFTVSANAPLAADGTGIRLSAAATSQTRDPDPANDGDSASVSVAAVADLGVVLNGLPEYRRNGQQLRYTVLLSNHGPSPAIDPEVRLETTLPAARVTLATPEPWSCVQAPGSGSGFAATCTIEPGVLYGASGAVFQIVVDGSTRLMPPRFRVSARASSASTDPVPANDSRELDVRMVR